MLGYNAFGRRSGVTKDDMPDWRDFAPTYRLSAKHVFAAIALTAVSAGFFWLALYIYYRIYCRTVHYSPAQDVCGDETATETAAPTAAVTAKNAWPYETANKVALAVRGDGRVVAFESKSEIFSENDEGFMLSIWKDINLFCKLVIPRYSQIGIIYVHIPPDVRLWHLDRACNGNLETAVAMVCDGITKFAGGREIGLVFVADEHTFNESDDRNEAVADANIIRDFIVNNPTVNGVPLSFMDATGGDQREEQ
ncbi:MAG: hypothetical protein LBI39_02280 [Puniceicoccales bacterium]|nr:hypothetical protein [Puniceicoccales bacterium]